IQTYQTDEFGIPTSSQGTSTQPFGYTGQQVDGDGLIYLRARMYDPTSGRLLGRDVVGGSTLLPASLNRYSYTQDNPMNMSDPSGLCTDPGGPGIRYCLETFIPQPSIWGFQGDGRGPNSSGGSYRTQQLIFQTPSRTTTSSSQTGRSTLETLLGSLSRRADPWLCGAGKSKVLGGRDLFATCAASDGLFYGYAPPAAYTIVLQETAQGVRVLDARGTRFPSIEVWQYGGAQAPQLVYYYDSQAAGTGPLDLLNRGSLLTR
ncbi:MAG: RHS repeat-associated core domain-containing protein, partial [Candidatus Dormibacteraceae bacterium]